MKPPETDHARWFADEVHPHDASLRAYMRGAFPKLRDVDDVVQESYVRILGARTKHPIQSAKAFLFAIAHRLALDQLRRDRTVPMDQVADMSQVSDAEGGVTEIIGRNEQVDLLADAIASLPARCREITLLRKIRGQSQKEVAALLGLSERTVEVQVARGVRRCEEYLVAKGVRSFYDR